MKLYLGLMWIKSNRSLKSSFKLPGSFELFEMYFDRLQPCCEAEVQHVKIEALAKRPPGEVLWLCERLKGRSKVLGSEDVAQCLEKLKMEGVKKLWVVVGPPDGVPKETIDSLRPDLLWSFGPATYPHELATVIAAEQLYRGFMILKGHPYHLGH
ncbi:MAG: 23S rRNA (pseudouridine(1915)-N(3))-methyltransferase RlmH [Bdellovibrionota bacterium]